MGVHDVVVTNPYGSVTLAGAFTYTGTATTLDDAVLDAASSTLSWVRARPATPPRSSSPRMGQGRAPESSKRSASVPSAWSRRTCQTPALVRRGYSFGASGGDVYSGSAHTDLRQLRGDVPLLGRRWAQLALRGHRRRLGVVGRPQRRQRGALTHCPSTPHRETMTDSKLTHIDDRGRARMVDVGERRSPSGARLPVLG